MGGFVAQSVAMHEPSLVRKVVLIGTGPGGNPENEPQRYIFFQIALQPEYSFAPEPDVRDEWALRKAFEAGVGEIGPVDIVIANAGVALLAVDEAHEAWQDTTDINLTGVLNTIETVVPSMIERGAGGSIVVASTVAGLRGVLGPSRAALGYVASKHGVVGLMRSYANILAPHLIRVNSVHPSGVSTPMITAASMAAFLDANPKIAAGFATPMPIPLLEARDVSNAVLYLVSDDGRYVTGTTLSIDGGRTNKV